MNRRQRRGINPKSRCAICKQAKIDTADYEFVDDRVIHGPCARKRRMEIGALLRAAKRMRETEKERNQ